MNLIAKEISAISNNPEDVYIVHYSHGDTNKANHYCQRVYCIYAQNLNGSESKKFSIEKYAQKGKIDISVIEDWYDDLELSVLDEFNDFLRAKSHCTFVYWVEDGHELILDVIKARFEEINKNAGKNFTDIPSTKRKSIQFLIKKIESESPVEMKDFIKKFNNQQIITNYLTNSEEINCFNKKEFNKVGASVISKVSFFVKLLNDSAGKQVNTKSNLPIDIRSLTPKDLFSRMTWGSWLILIGLVITSFGGGWGLNKWLEGRELKESNDSNDKLRNEIITDSIEYQKNIDKWKDSISILKENNVKLDAKQQEQMDSINLLTKKLER